MRSVFTFLVLMVVWVVLSGQFDAFHLGLGVLSCALVTFMASHYFYGDDESRPIMAYVLLGLRFIPYALWLLKEITLANLHILRLSLSPWGMRSVEPTMQRVHTRLSHPAARYVLANSITLTPGTVTLSLEGDILLVHSISSATSEGLRGEMEARIATLFGETLTGQPQVTEQSL